MIAQLDTKTVYSFMESVVSIEKYVQIAKKLWLFSPCYYGCG